MACCPICTDAIDYQGQRFLPCPCGFQLCFWCFKKIQDSINTCPKCRAPYIDENLRFRPADDSDDAEDGANCDDQQSEESISALSSTSTVSSHIARRKDSRCAANNFTTHQPGSRGGHVTGTVSSTSSATAQSKKSVLRDVRVVRRDLCYLVGLPLESTIDEASLKSFEFFGKYGKVVNIIVNRNPNFKSPDKKKSCAVYITYSSHAEAKLAINDIDQCTFQNRKLRASYGTTKYCSNYLRSQKCNNKTCFYLHQKGAEEDSFTIDQLNSVKEKSRDLTCSAILSHELTDGVRVCPIGMSLFGKTRQEVLSTYENLMESKYKAHVASSHEVIMKQSVASEKDCTGKSASDMFVVLASVRSEVLSKIRTMGPSSDKPLPQNTTPRSCRQVGEQPQETSKVVVVPPPPRLSVTTAPMVHPSLRKEWGWSLSPEFDGAGFCSSLVGNPDWTLQPFESNCGRCVAPPKMTSGPSQLIKMQCVTMADLTASYSSVCARDPSSLQQQSTTNAEAPPGLY